ncbi:hypothetical protein [Massilia timonae]|uniref:hypothetical protein n=1 Tax=Massilia timonae TaxID=47229 RepID=UPI0028D55713|nr:hypothetical protein [Massilia timonae]
MSRSIFLLPLLLSSLSLPAQAATLLLCPGAPLASPGAVTEDYTTAMGARMRAIVTEAPGKPDPGCRAVPLKVAASGVQALHFLPLDAAPGETILLRGEQSGKEFTVTGHTLGAPPPLPTLQPGLATQAPVDAADVRRRAPRATWAWSPNAWRERADAMLDWAAEQGMGELFINVPVRAGTVAEPQALAAFVRQADSRGIAVTAFEDGPDLILPTARADAVGRMRAYAAYNAQAGARARLKGVQFDVQPQLLDPDKLPKAARDNHYLDLLAALRGAAGTMRLEAVAPAAWSGEDALLRGLARHVDALTVRTYRTDPDEIRRHAAPFLDWGVQHGKRVRIALEAGPAGAGVERQYRRLGPGTRGDLLMFDLDGQKVLMLLKVPAAQDEAQAYALAGRRDIAGSATTFHFDKPALMRLLPQLERGFGAWKSFGGMAVHALR